MKGGEDGRGAGVKGGVLQFRRSLRVSESVRVCARLCRCACVSLGQGMLGCGEQTVRGEGRRNTTSQEGAARCPLCPYVWSPPRVSLASAEFVNKENKRCWISQPGLRNAQPGQPGQRRPTAQGSGGWKSKAKFPKGWGSGEGPLLPACRWCLWLCLLFRV